MTAVWHAVAPGPGCPQCSVRGGPQTAGWPPAATHHQLRGADEHERDGPAGTGGGAAQPPGLARSPAPGGHRYGRRVGAARLVGGAHGAGHRPGLRDPRRSGSGRPRRPLRISPWWTSGSAPSTSTTTCVPTVRCRRRAWRSGRSVGASWCPRRRSASAADLDLRPVSVTLTRAPSSDVVPGALVDLWFTPTAPTDDAETVDAPQAGRQPHGRRGERAVGHLRCVGRDRGPGAGPQLAASGGRKALAADGTVDVVPVLGTGG